MKQYGKRGRNVVGFQYLEADNSVQLSDSEDWDDDSKAALEPSSEQTEHFFEKPVDFNKSITGKIIDASVDLSQDTTVSNSFELDAFEFMDHTAERRKRKRTIYKKVHGSFSDAESVHDKSTEHINETMNDLDDFLTSLQAVDEQALTEKMGEEMVTSELKTIPQVSQKRLYGNKRTFLKKENSDEEEEVSEEQFDQRHDDKNNVLNSDVPTTHHYNELKNIGDTVRYQDDLEFLTNGEGLNVDSDQSMSELINLALTICNDESFTAYLRKNRTKELYSWCSHLWQTKNPVTLILLGFIATKVSFTERNMPKYFNSFVTSLSSQVQKPSKVLIKKKLAQMNYVDFCKRIDNQNGLLYAIELWKRYASQFSQDEKTIQQIINLLKTHLESQKEPAELILQLVETFILKNVMSSKFQIYFCDILSDSLPSCLTQQSLIKSLILLTNNTDTLGMLSLNLKKKIVECSIAFVLDNIYPLNQELGDSIILHLGLCLNLISESQTMAEITNEIFEKSLAIFEKLSSTVRTKTQSRYTFMFDMFYLNFAYMSYKSNTKLLTFENKTVLKSLLERFKNQTTNINEQLAKKTSIVLQNYL